MPKTKKKLMKLHAKFEKRRGQMERIINKGARWSALHDDGNAIIKHMSMLSDNFDRLTAAVAASGVNDGKK